MCCFILSLIFLGELYIFKQKLIYDIFCIYYELIIVIFVDFKHRARKKVCWLCPQCPQNAIHRKMILLVLVIEKFPYLIENTRLLIK